MPFDPMGMLFAPLGLLAIFLGRRKKVSKWGMWIALLLIAGSVGITLSACQTGDFTATVTATPGSPVGTGTITFESGTTVSGTVPVSPVGTPVAVPTACLTPTQTPTPTGTPTPGGVPLGDFLITHYNMALESDPAFRGCDNCYEANIPIWENGKIEYYRHNNAFVYGILSPGTTSGYNWGVLQEGTGITLSNKHISIDPHHKTENNRTVFVYQEGGACVIHQEAWLTVAAHDPSILPCGAKVTIDKYPGRIFTVTDTGSDVGPRQLDVFVGPMNKSDFETMFAAPESTYFSSKVRRVG